MDKQSSGISPAKETEKVTTVKPAARGSGRPGWASGLRQLYDSVADEPLPDSLKDLLTKLDQQS